MHRDRLNMILGKLHQPGTADQTCKQALEAGLLSRYRTLYPKNRRWLMLLNPWNRFARIAFTSLALCLVVVGACNTDTITEVELGKQLQMDLALETNIEFKSKEDMLAAQEYMTRETSKMSKLLTAQPGVEDASVSISKQITGEISLQILAWGTGFNEADLVSTLTSEYPELAGASVSVSDLNTSVKESLASKVGRKLFNIELSGSDPEELRLQLLQQMAAEGITGDAKVDVQTEGDQATITIEMEGE